MKKIAVALLFAMAAIAATPVLAGEPMPVATPPEHIRPLAATAEPRFQLAAEAAPAPLGYGAFEGSFARLAWQPQADGWRLSTGVLIGDIRVAALETALANGRAAASQHAPIEARRQLAPYVGIGFGAPEVGQGFYGRAGMVTAAVAEASRPARDQEVYPVLELGWSYRF